MTAQLAHIWRHPIKGIGSEALEQVRITPHAAVVGDRAWALLHDNAAADTADWQSRRNFLVVANGPALAGVTARTVGAQIELTHKDREPLLLDPAMGQAALHEWIGDLWPAERPTPARLVKAPVQGMTDVPYPSVSIGNLSTLRALSDRVGRPMDMRRFRINLWLDGLAPFEEVDLLSSDIQIGDVRFAPVEPIERCRAPDASPETGTRDLGMLPTLEQAWQTRDFGVYFKAVTEGDVRLGDTLARVS